MGLPSAEMEALGAGQGAQAQVRERHPVTGVLDAYPGQLRIEVIAAVLKHGASLERVGELLDTVVVARPDRRGQAVRAVVHQLERLMLVADLHQADRGSKG